MFWIVVACLLVGGGLALAGLGIAGSNMVNPYAKCINKCIAMQAQREGYDPESIPDIVWDRMYRQCWKSCTHFSGPAVMENTPKPTHVPKPRTPE
jgi:hypothetical protein